VQALAGQAGGAFELGCAEQLVKDGGIWKVVKV
jgi:hypothetical protein